MELDTPEYWGRIKGDLIVEKQLAMGGSEFAFLAFSLPSTLSSLASPTFFLRPSPFDPSHHHLLPRSSNSPFLTNRTKS